MDMHELGRLIFNEQRSLLSPNHRVPGICKATNLEVFGMELFMH